MVGGGRSTIQGATQNTQMDADSEVADLIQKYKLFGGQTDNNSPANEAAGGEGSATELVTEENIDDGDEAVISKQKKRDFEQPVQYAGPDGRD